MMFEVISRCFSQFCDDVWGLMWFRSTVLWWCLRKRYSSLTQFCDDVWGCMKSKNTVLWWCLRSEFSEAHSFVMMFEVYKSSLTQFCDDVWGKAALGATVLWWCLRLFSEWPTVLYVLNSNKLELSFAASAGNIISLLKEIIGTIYS